MSADELLRRWAARRLECPPEDVASVDFSHEDAYTDPDSGTYWPSETRAVVTMAGGRAARPFLVGDFEAGGLTALIREILEVPRAS